MRAAKFRSANVIAALLIAVMAQLTFAIPPQGSRSFTGEIMDVQCAENGSHKSEMKRNGTTNSRECTLYCLKNGYKLVLYNRATKTIYQIDDQEKAKQFAGERIEITGSFEDSTKTIHVEQMKRIP